MHVEILLNEHPDAVRRGYRPNDDLRPVYSGDVDLPGDDATALRIIYSYLARDEDGNTEGWDAHRFAQLGQRYEERPLRAGDVVILDDQRAFAVTGLDFEPIAAQAREDLLAGLRDSAAEAQDAHEADELRRTAYEAWQAGSGAGRQDLDDLALRAAAQHAQVVGDTATERAIDGLLAAREARRSG